MIEIVAHPAHRPRAERLDPRGFERIEYAARIGVRRSNPGMELGIMVAEAKRERIRGAARFGDQAAPRVRARARERARFCPRPARHPKRR